MGTLGLQDDYRVLVHQEEPDLPIGQGQAEHAPLMGQQRVRLLACATCLLLVGWQAPGRSLGGFGREGRVLMHLEDSSTSALGSLDIALSTQGQPGRMLRHIIAGDTAENAVIVKDLFTLDSALGPRLDASQHMGRQVLGGEELGRLQGHHKLPKWAR